MAREAAIERHPVARAAGSTAPPARAARLVVAALAVVLGVVQLLSGPVALLSTSSIYLRDFTQEYTLARAVADGADPYAPVAELAERYIGVSLPAIGREALDTGGAALTARADTAELGNHPTPHPPTVALVALPLALLSFPAASAVWMGFELLCLAAAIWLIARADRVRLAPIAAVAATLALVSWGPVATELAFGQLTLPSLALLGAARLAQSRGRPALAGLLLGAAILLKPTPWPIVALMAAHRQWRLVAGSVAAVMLGYAAAVAVLGPSAIARYFVEVLPAVNRIYATSVYNVSAWSVGWRALHGTRAVAAVGVDSPPLIDAPGLAGGAAALLPLLLLAAAAAWAWRRPGVDLCLGVGAALSVLLSPVAWSFYTPLAAIAGWQSALALHRHGYPRRQTNWLLAAALTCAVDWPNAAQAFLTPSLAANGNIALSFAEAQVHLVWTASLLAVAALAAQLGARGLIRDGGPMPAGTSGSLSRPSGFPRLGGLQLRASQIEGAKLT